jgi:hypothetical protein
MTIIPIRTISPLEKKILVYEHIDCKEKVKKIQLDNENEKENLVNLKKNFMAKYSKNLSYFLPFEENYNYDFEQIGKICDAVIADHTEGKNMSKFFEKTKINKFELLEECKNFLGFNFRDKYFGDDKNEVILVEVSELLREMLYYMKKRVDADINGENIEKNISDYSRPKMVIVSGHDTTVTPQLLYFIKYFNLSIDTYTLTSYSCQIAIEIARNETKENEKLTYSNYSARFFYNDLCIIDVKLDKFIDTIEKSIWSREKIDNFCLGEKEVENQVINTYLIIIIAIALFATILLIILIVVIIKMVNMKKSDDTDINSVDKRTLVKDNEDEE